MTLARSHPLYSDDTPLIDRHGAIWDSVMERLFERPEPTALSTRCTECNEFEIVCACVRAGDEGSEA